MKICIIHINKSSAPLPTLEESPNRFIRCITPYIDMDVAWDVSRLFGDNLPRIQDYDGFLITGGSAPLLAEDLPQESADLLIFIQDVYESKKPLVGICWGHQAVCRAMGGKLAKFDAYGMGIKETEVLKTYDWMQYAPDSIKLYSMHTCQVVSPPPQGELFLSSDFCKYAGFVFDNHVLTMQQHPDYNIDVSLAMIHRRADRLSDEELNIAIDSLQDAHHTELASKWVGNFFLQHK